MDGVEVYRPDSARPIAVAAWATCAALGAGRLAAGPLDALATYAVLGGVALVALLAWAALWRPRIEVAPYAVVLRDPLRTVTVTWPALVAVEGRFGLRVETAGGRFSAWAAAPPQGRDRRRGEESEAAQLVRAQWEALREQGHLEGGVVEQHPEVVRHVGLALALGGGLLVVAALALLG